LNYKNNDVKCNKITGFWIEREWRLNQHF